MVDNMPKARRLTIIVRPSLPNLLPGLLKVETAIGDPEARSRAIATLCQVSEVPEGDETDLPLIKGADNIQLATLPYTRKLVCVWYHC